MAERDVALRVRDLGKSYGGVRAVDGLDLEVGRGETVGLLGPNGAGKTTTLRILTCLASRDRGAVDVLGMDPGSEGRTLKRRLGVVTQANTLDLELSVRENLLVFARYFDVPRAEAERRAERLLGEVELGDRGDDPVATVSGGMQRRLQIARALVGAPELLVLDEPTTGLDPHARHVVWRYLDARRREGLTVLVTTHYMDEAMQLCDRVVIINHGRVVAEGAPAELIERVGGGAVAEIEDGDDLTLPSDLRPCRVDDRQLVFGPSLERLSRELPAERVASLRPATLEDVFLVATGERLDGDAAG